jgi:hypothetical protein
VRARTKELGEARRSRSLKGQERLTTHEKPMPTLHAVPEAAVATKYLELKLTVATEAPSAFASSAFASSKPHTASFSSTGRTHPGSGR